MGDREASLRHFMPVGDMLGIVRDHFDAGLAVGEMHEGEDAGFMDDGLGFFGFGEAVRDGDVAVAFSVDTRHLAAEELAVCGGVAELVDGDEVMDHLMDDGVLDEVFRQINAGIDAENKVLILIAAKQTLLAASEGDFAQKAFGVGQSNRYRRKLPTKEAGVVVVEARLYVRDGGDQLQFLALKGTII